MQVAPLTNNGTYSIFFFLYWPYWITLSVHLVHSAHCWGWVVCREISLSIMHMWPIKCVNQWGLNCDRRLMNGASIDSFSVVCLLYKQTLSTAFCVCPASLYLCLGKQRKPILCQVLFKKRSCEDRLARLNKSKLTIKCLDVPADFYLF